MPFIAYKGEKTRAELVQRIYGKLPVAEAKARAEALLAANPHLSDMTKLQEGVPIVAPAQKEKEPVSGAIQTDWGRSSAGMIDRSLTEAVSDLKARVTIGATGIDQDVEGLKNPLLKQAIKQAPEFAKLVERTKQSLRERKSELNEANLFATQVLPRVKRDLVKLLGDLA